MRYRRVPIITAPVIFGFSRPKGPLLSDSRYFRMVRKRLKFNSGFTQRGRITDIKKVIQIACSLFIIHVNKVTVTKKAQMFVHYTLYTRKDAWY